MQQVDYSNESATLAFAIRLRQESKKEELSSLTVRAIKEVPQRSMLLVNLGIYARDAGLFDIADRAFLHVIQNDPTGGFAYYELAMSHLLRGEHRAALGTLEPLLSLLPMDVRANILAARLLMATGSHDDASARLDIAATVEPGRPELKWLGELNQYLQAFPRSRALELCRSLETNSRYFQLREVAQKIREAVRDRRPFSLIRLGDGEGAFVQISEEDERQFAKLYRHNRLDRSYIWFNDELDIEASGFQNTAFGIRAAVQNADIVGIPYTGWVEHEFKMLSPTGMSSLVNVLRLMSLPHASQSLTSQLIHMDLGRAWLPDLLRKQPVIGLIACHSGLAQRLKAAFGLQHVQFYKTPGEKAHRHIIGPSATAGQHYPDRFRAIMKDLEKPHDGRIFLVAAGLLGKLYCDQIKRFGGIGLDIGSLADAWMGANTRPGYDKLNLALPDAHGANHPKTRPRLVTKRHDASALPTGSLREKHLPFLHHRQPSGSDGMTLFDDMISRLWGGQNPYNGFPPNLIVRDLQGWNSHHPYLTQAINETKAPVVVEVGVWKGASSIHMAKHMRDMEHDGIIISVDTFLGSWDHWQQPELFRELSFAFGYPQLYYKFISNVISEGVSSYIVPLPLDSNNAFRVIASLGICPGVVHIDGGHDYDAVLSDLRRWWSLIPDCGQLIIDDYDDSGKVWPSVREAVVQFRREISEGEFAAEPYKARLVKHSKDLG